MVIAPLSDETADAARLVLEKSQATGGTERLDGICHQTSPTSQEHRMHAGHAFDQLTGRGVLPENCAQFVLVWEQSEQLSHADL